MTNNNSYNKLCSVSRKILKDVDTTIECLVNLECDEIVTKILSLNVDGVVNSSEALSGEANSNGIATISLVYVTENGLVGNASYTAPFGAKFVDLDIKPDYKVFAKVKNIESHVESINNNTVKIQCQITCCAFCLQNYEVEFIDEVDGNCCCQETLLEYNSFKGATQSNWTENLQLSVKDNIKKILTSLVDVDIKEYKCGVGFVSVNYDLISKLTYVTQEENAQIKTIYTKQDFKQEIESEYVTNQSKIELQLFVQKHEIKTTITENEDEMKVDIDVPLQANICVYESEQKQVIKDLFSTQNLVNITTKDFSSIEICEPMQFEKKIEGNLTLSEDEPRIDKLLAVSYSKATILNQYLQNGEYNVSGIITSNLIYFNEDESVPCSIDVEVPFVVTNQTELEGDYFTELNATLKDVDVMVKRGREVFVDATLCMFVNVCKFQQKCVIGQVEYKEEVPVKDCAIEIYFAKAGERIWDIAKSLFVKPELIYAQNPNIPDTLEEDTKLAIYYQKNKSSK